MLVEIKKINKEEVSVVTSLDVAETFTYFDEDSGKEYAREHKAILRAIRELNCSEEFRGEHYSPSNYVDTRGKIQPCMIMDRDGFTMLVMGFIDPKAMKFKEAYIKQFNAMEKALIGKIKEREKGIAVRQALTNALQKSQESERMHGHAYSTYTNAIYRVLFGKDAKQLREDFGLEKKDDLRDMFSTEELSAIQSMERLVSGLIDCGWGYEQIKNFISETSVKQLAG